MARRVLRRSAAPFHGLPVHPTICRRIMQMPPVTIIAAADLTNVLFIGAAVFGALLLGGAGYLLVRRVRAWTQQDEKIESFTLQDLRELRQRGEISPKEYDALRKTIIAGVAADAPADELPADDGQSSPRGTTPKDDDPPDGDGPGEEGPQEEV